MKEYALIVAGGIGVRMQNECPKPFIELCGKPILLHTIEAFCRYSNKITIILVLAKANLDRWNALCNRYTLDVPIHVQKGGETRFQSVKNGLRKITGDGLVAIHDGVRPLVDPKIIKTSFEVAAVHQTAIAAVALKDSIRKVHHNDTSALNRLQHRLTQTPQTFNIHLIKKAYEMSDGKGLTDDASVVEQAGHAVHLFEGDYKNIKITTAEDLIIANALLLAGNRNT